MGPGGRAVHGAPYLTALYSIQDPTSPAYRLIRSVVIEEMLHMMLVCNLRNAIGDAEVGLHPDVLAVAARYPTFIPHHAVGGPYVQLQAASVALVRTVFMGIEQPAFSGAPAEADEFETIGQFYEAIAEGFRTLDAQGSGALFTGDPHLQQVGTYFGGGGGRLIPVINLKSALLAIEQIIAQGEGATRGHPPRPGEEGFGVMDGYGLRDDGTIGPLVGSAWEQSHYKKFSLIAEGQAELGAVWPMQPNPDTAALEGRLRDLSQLFDDLYGILLRCMQATLCSAQERGLFFTAVLPLMHTALPDLSRALMQSPIYEGADPTLGPNAGPSFLVGTASVAEAQARCQALIRHATGKGASDLARDQWLPALRTVADVLAALPPIAD